MKTGIESRFFDCVEQIGKIEATVVFIDSIEAIAKHCDFQELKGALHQLSCSHPKYDVLEEILKLRAQTFQEKQFIFDIYTSKAQFRNFTPSDNSDQTGLEVQHQTFEELMKMASSLEEKKTLLYLASQLVFSEREAEDSKQSDDEICSDPGEHEERIRQEFRNSSEWQRLYFEAKEEIRNRGFNLDERLDILRWAEDFGRLEEDGPEILDEMFESSETLSDLFESYWLRKRFLKETITPQKQHELVVKMSKTRASVSDCWNVWQKNHEHFIFTLLLEKLAAAEREFSEWAIILIYDRKSYGYVQNDDITPEEEGFYTRLDALAKTKMKNYKQANLDYWLQQWEKHTFDKEISLLCREAIKERCHTFQDWHKVLEKEKELSKYTRGYDKNRDWAYEQMRKLI